VNDLMTNATHLAVIYATNSKVLRRKVIPDNDAQLYNLIVQRGESLLLIPLDQP